MDSLLTDKNFSSHLTDSGQQYPLLQLQGHTTHQLQPLDIAFQPLYIVYEQAMSKWLGAITGKVVTQSETTKPQVF
jgi:hypothetical protein